MNLAIDVTNLTYRGETLTGPEFDNLVIACADDGAGKFYRFLFDEYGNHAIHHPKAQALSNFFGYRFSRAKLDGVDCLVNIE